MFYGKINDTSDIAGRYEIWTINIYKSISNQLTKIQEIDLLGVKINLSPTMPSYYRNGINAGDLDGDGIPELLVCAFPNFYSFQ